MATNNMEIEIREFLPDDIDKATEIWNEVVRDGVAFPQTEELGKEDGLAFFGEQTYTGIAVDNVSGDILGLYILHPNNIGRCGHICNASYAVKSTFRDQHIGEALIKHCLLKAKELGFGIMQFNAVVATNHRALHLYKKLGFVRLGTIPGGFRLDDGSFVDIVPHYYVLK